MSDLIATAFPARSKAEEARQKLLGLQKEYLIESSDAVVRIDDTWMKDAAAAIQPGTAAPKSW